jgi:RNA polymerase sigma factor (sigma-70 family)
MGDGCSTGLLRALEAERRGYSDVIVAGESCPSMGVCMEMRAASAEDRSPPFLAMLDSDREAAWRQFHDFFRRSMVAGLPRRIHLFPRDRHEDLVQELLLALVDRNFARLRQYRDQGKPFVGWLYSVCNRLLIDWRNRKVPGDPAGSDTDAGDPDRLNVPAPPARAAVPDQLARAVRSAWDRLDTFCKALLAAAVEDRLKPREIASLFRLPADDNKAISNKVRSCKDSLRRHLRDVGYGPEEIRHSLDL